MPGLSQSRSVEKIILLGELESLGFSSVHLNDLNDIAELGGLVELIKQSLLQEYRRHWNISRMTGGSPSNEENVKSFKLHASSDKYARSAVH